MKATKTLSQRMSAILKWCDARQINQVFAFFKGCDVSIALYETRVRFVLRTSSSSVTDTDEPWIESMEATIAALNNRKAAA